MLPPREFVPAGSVSTATRTTESFEASKSAPVHPRHQKGLRYEKAVGTALSAWAEARNFSLELGPWFRFLGGTGGRWSRYDTPENSISPSAWRWCQPDAIINSDAGAPLLILEIKLNFEPKAWWQLAELYRPVVEKATGRQVRFAGVCGSFDPAIGARLPVYVEPSFGSPRSWLDITTANAWERPAAFHVLQWKKPSVDDLSLDGW